MEGQMWVIFLSMIPAAVLAFMLGLLFDHVKFNRK